MQNVIGVIGAGQMGLGIAQTFASAGFEVVLNDTGSEVMEQGLVTISNSLSRLADKQVLKDSPDNILRRIHCSTDIQAVAECRLVVEAVSENEALKQQIFRQLDSICHPQTVLASNTSSISITRLAAVTKRPEKVVGIHFMNPVPLMQLVEVIRGLQTSDSVYQAVTDLTGVINKTAVTAQDHPGFIVNRILIPMINEAVFTLSEGVGSAEEIDQAMTLGANQPLGPLALADLIGLDTCLSIMQVLLTGFNDPKYRPCPLLVQMVDAGYLGRKTGRGFFSYE